MNVYAEQTCNQRGGKWEGQIRGMGLVDTDYYVSNR